MGGRFAARVGPEPLILIKPWARQKKRSQNGRVYRLCGAA
jgi:hypothetical protein